MRALPPLQSSVVKIKASMNDKTIPVQVCYAPTVDTHTVIDLNVDETCTVEHAILQSGILEKHPEINLPINNRRVGNLLPTTTIGREQTGEQLVYPSYKPTMTEDQSSETKSTVNKVGIFSKLTKLDATLHPQDRIEIYRPLSADPKELRRARQARSVSV